MKRIMLSTLFVLTLALAGVAYADSHLDYPQGEMPSTETYSNFVWVAWLTYGYQDPAYPVGNELSGTEGIVGLSQAHCEERAAKAVAHARSLVIPVTASPCRAGILTLRIPE